VITMKKMNKIVFVACLSAATTSAMAAEAGKVSFHGQLTDGTCGVSVVDTGNSNGSGYKAYDRDGMVFLPTTVKGSVKALNTSAPGVGAEKFQIKMDCSKASGTLGANAKLALFSPIQDIDGSLKNNYQGNAVAAKNVNIAIHNANGTSGDQIIVGTGVISEPIDSKTKIAIFTLQASYVLAQGRTTVDAEAGLIDTLTQYTIDYQ
jgi:major type 1 subunit fimbrin (pilin)